MALMRSVGDGNWKQFIRLLERSYPKFGYTIPMDFDKNE